MRLAPLLVTLCLLTTACRSDTASTSPPSRPTADFTDIAAAKWIVTGRLSANVHRSDGHSSCVAIENVRPLRIDRMPSEDGGWPKDKMDLCLTADDAFKPGDEGVWLLQWTDHVGWAAPGPHRFRSAIQRDAFLGSLERWLAERVTAQIDLALVALRQDPDGDAEPTWRTVRQLTVLLENEIRLPQYEDRPNENPVRVHLAAFCRALGAEPPIPPDPRTRDELARAGHLLRPAMYYNPVLDQPDDPRFRALLDQALDSYWRGQLLRITSSLAATPGEFRQEVEMRRHLATPESAAVQFPPGVPVTRMGLFLGHPRFSGRPATASSLPSPSSTWSPAGAATTR